MNKWRNVIKDSILNKKPYSFKKQNLDIKLDQNESPYDIPDDLKREILDKAIANSWNRYPDISGLPLRSALSRYLDVPEKMIAVGVGSDELLNAVSAIVLNSGKTSMWIEPTFQIYRSCSNTFESKCVNLLLNKELQYPVENILKTLTN
jgi:histidinol-phosphate aminotransferase